MDSDFDINQCELSDPIKIYERIHSDMICNPMYASSKLIWQLNQRKEECKIKIGDD